MSGCSMHTFALFRFMLQYACHACLCHPLAFYASLYTCLHVHAWFLLASVLSMIKHNEVMDIRSKPTFVPRRHHLLLVFLLVCLFSCFLACLFAFLLSCSFVYLCMSCLQSHAMLAISILLVYSVPFCALSTHLFLSIAGFLFLPLHVHTWSENTQS